MKPDVVQLSSAAFDHLIPYHVLWDRGTPGSVELSPALQRLWGLPRRVDTARVRLVRPFRTPLDARLFPELTDMVLTLGVSERPSAELRGELVPIGEGRLLFACLPPVSRVADLERLDMRLSDLPLHTGLGDALIAVEAAQVSLEESQAARRSLEATNASLEALNEAFGRFVPRPFLHALGVHSPEEARLGTQSSVDATVMFADLRNFTSMSESLPSDEIFGFVNRYLSHVSPKIRQHEGFVVHYLGDGILALFHRAPDQAVWAAIGMQEALREAVAAGGLADQLPIGTELRLGIGLHRGRIEMGIVGESGRWDTSVISDVVNTASRVEGLTKRFGSQVLFTSALMEALEAPEVFLPRRLGLVGVRGRVQRVEVFEALAARPPGVRAQMVATRSRFEDSVHALEEGDAATALAGFQWCLAACPSDAAARSYVAILAER